MKQVELNRAVANVTGEAVNRIERMGFTLVNTEVNDYRRCLEDDRSVPRLPVTPANHSAPAKCRSIH